MSDLITMFGLNLMYIHGMSFKDACAEQNKLRGLNEPDLKQAIAERLTTVEKGDA